MQKLGIQKKDSHNRSSMEGALVGHRRIQRAALPLQRELAHLWNRWQVHSVGEIPSRWPMRRPMAAIVEDASSLQPPRDSTTSGMKVTPAERHASAWAANMVNYACAIADPVYICHLPNSPRDTKGDAKSTQEIWYGDAKSPGL